MKYFKNITRVWFAALIIWSSSISFSQQLPQYTQWAAHQLVLNPAHAGIKPCFDVHSLFRYQWTGIDGAPQTGVVTMSTPLFAKRKFYLSARHGIGGKIERDQIGQFSTTRINIAYSGHFNFSKFDRLSLGLYVGLVQASYDPSNAIIHDPDPVIMNHSLTTSPDATFGAWWNSENYFVGLVLQNLIPTKYFLGNQSAIKMHSYINGGYRHALPNDFTLLPSAIIRMAPKAPINFDINLNAYYKNEFGLGVGYRNTDALLFFMTIKLDEIVRVQYSFDYVVSKMSSPLVNPFNNSHELSISFSNLKTRHTGPNVTPLF